jgi:hypothetical protein
VAFDLVGGRVDRDAAADQAADLVALAQEVQREGEDGLDLVRVRPQVELGRLGDVPDEGVDKVAGDEGPGRRQRLADLDQGRIEPDLLLGLAQRGGGEVSVTRVPAPARERDLAGVAPQVGAPLGEDEPRFVGPPIERQQDRRLRQMITWTVPPSTDQAAPET